MVALGSGNNTPKRIQMSRRNPWRADNPDAIRVDRATRFGNPFVIGEEFRVQVNYGYGGYAYVLVDDREDAVELFRDWMLGETDISRRRPDATVLVGRDLACWCPLEQPCHADVLLELANGAKS